MEYQEVVRVSTENYGDAEKNKNIMLKDNCDRIDFVLSKFKKYLKDYDELVNDYLNAHYDIKKMLLSVYVPYLRTNLANGLGGPFDYPYNFADFNSVGQYNWYAYRASAYFSAEGKRIRLLAKLSCLKENILNCVNRLEVIEKNVENNYKKSDSFGEPCSEKQITKKLVLQKAQETKEKLKKAIVEVKYLRHIPSAEQVIEISQKLNALKKDYNIKAQIFEGDKFCGF